MNKGKDISVEAMSHFMDDEIREAEEQYRAILAELDSMVKSGDLRKSGYKYENNPRRRNNARDEKTTLNLIRTADGMRASVTIVRRAIDEMKRARGAVISNAKLVKEAHTQMGVASDRYSTHRQQYGASRKREVKIVSEGNHGQPDSQPTHGHGKGKKAMAKKTSKKKVSKKTAAKSESSRINYEELSDNQRSKMLGELGHELVGALEAGGDDGQAAARGLRAKLRRIDLDWTENCKPYAAFKKAQAKARDAATPAPAETTKKKSKKKTTKKKAAKAD